MFRSKKFASTLIIAVLLALAALNSFWGYSQAQTVPTKRTRTPTQAITATQANPPQNTAQPTDNTPNGPTPTNALDQTPSNYFTKKFQIVPDEGADVSLRYEGNLSGIVFEAGAFCNSGAAIVALLPNDAQDTPGKGQLTFYRPVIDVLLFVKTRVIQDQEQVCGTLEDLTGTVDFSQYFPATNTLYKPYFDLTGRERFIYDSMKDKAGIFWYNPDSAAWEQCQNQILDESKGIYGRLYCLTTKTGLFTFGVSGGTP